MAVSVFFFCGLVVLILICCFLVEFNISSVIMLLVLVLVFLLLCKSILVLKFCINLNSFIVGWVCMFSLFVILIVCLMVMVYVFLVYDGVIGCFYCVSGSSLLVVL